ncbi:MAG: NAD(P)/FAD-dependent oxidoreductase [Leptospiraceae bacterium]|nr:NAD(P)/FAD-dependent oxidoreductase [Leptospiraceae bacterium]
MNGILKRRTASTNELDVRGAASGPRPSAVVQVIIVGAGFSGMAAAARLKKEGENSFVILEKAAEVGGTWRDNTYPGCACDVKSNLYSYSFAPRSNWSRLYAPQPEIFEYLKECSHNLGLRDHIRFNSQVQEARFDKKSASWKIKVSEKRAGKSARQYWLEARLLVMAPGPLNRPFFPDIPGLQDFPGPVFHSSQWDHSVDLKGKRVAVVGSGASAIQVVPGIIDEVKELHLFQRSAAYVTPRNDRPVAAWKRRLFARLPSLQRLQRLRVYAYNELIAGNAIYGSRLLSFLATRLALRHMRSSIKDPELQARLTPGYRIGCKRVLLSDDYYPALARSHTRVISSAVSSIAGNCVRGENGEWADVDVIILCTGFQVSNMHRALDLDVFGSDGQSLKETWERDGMQAHLGTTVSGFPNMLFYLGPNTGLGHNSMVHIMESQSNYLADYLSILRRNPGQYLDVRPDAQQAFNKEVDRKMQGSAWIAGGCSSWYLNSKGQNNVLWPGSTLSFRNRTRVVSLRQYRLLSTQQA